VFLKLIKVHLLVSELYIYRNISLTKMNTREKYENEKYSDR